MTSALLPPVFFDPSMCSLAASPARMFRKPESGPESMDLARAFGLSSPVLLGSFDPDTWLPRTSQGSLLHEEQWGESLETWPDSGMWDAGAVYGLQSSARATSESACLSSQSTWNTPSTEDHKTDGPEVLGRYARGEAMTCDMRLRNQAMMWPTVRATSGGGNRSAYTGAPYREGLQTLAQTWPAARQEDGESCGNHPGAVDSLTGATKLWVTPQAHQGGANSQREARGSGGPDLKEQTENWKTPHGMSNRDKNGKVGGCGGGEFAKQANQWQTPATDSFRSRGGDRKDEQGLDQQARMFPTPTAADCRTPNSKAFSDRGGGKKGEQLRNFVEHSLPDQATPDGRQSLSNGPTFPRRLNPRFVSWLMGFDPTWTEL